MPASEGDGRGRAVRVDRRGASAADRGASGRRFVTVAVLTVLVLWGGLQVAFRQWRTRYRERAAYGLARVTRAFEPLATLVPGPGESSPLLLTSATAGAGALLVAATPGDVGVSVSPAAWRDAVAETRAMLETLTTANVLDRPGMDALATRVAAVALRARARPETARAELALLWDELEFEAGPLIDRRHPRPELLRAKVPGVEGGRRDGR